MAANGVSVPATALRSHEQKWQFRRSRQDLRFLDDELTKFRAPLVPVRRNAYIPRLAGLSCCTILTGLRGPLP